jgi:hypothetical protein
MESVRDVESAIVEGRLPRPRDIVGDVYPIELQLVLRKLLRPSQAGRFPDGAAARDALRLVAAARTEITQSHLGGWLKRTLADRHAAWRAIVGDAAGEVGGEEPPQLTDRVRPVSRSSQRSDTVRRFSIPAEHTEPAIPITKDRAATDVTAAPKLLQDQPTQVTKRVAFGTESEDDDEDADITLEGDASLQDARRATRVALNDIESLDDLPRRPIPRFADSGELTQPPSAPEIKATPMSSTEAIYDATPTPLLDIDRDRVKTLPLEFIAAAETEEGGPSLRELAMATDERVDSVTGPVQKPRAVIDERPIEDVPFELPLEEMPDWSSDQLVAMFDQAATADGEPKGEPKAAAGGLSNVADDL